MQKENVFEYIMGDIFPYLVKHTNLQIQEVQTNPKLDSKKKKLKEKKPQHNKIVEKQNKAKKMS